MTDRRAHTTSRTPPDPGLPASQPAPSSAPHTTADIPSSSPGSLLRIDALGVLDARTTCASPGSVLVELSAPPTHFPSNSASDQRHATSIRGFRILASGPSAEVALHPAARARTTHVIRRPRGIIIPGLVNAHSHLDLTHVGPQPFDPRAGFAGWGEKIGPARAQTAQAIADSTARGAALARSAGTLAVGDIVGSLPRLPLDSLPIVQSALQSAGLTGVTYREFFAIGAREQAGLDRLRQQLNSPHVPANSGQPLSDLVQALSPHAPYSVSPAALRSALAMVSDSSPIAIHLAESPEEHELIARATGPMRGWLERLGLWTSELSSIFGQGLSPIAHLAHALSGIERQGPTLFVHCNDLNAPADLQALAMLCAHTGGAVAYCPRASAYFQADYTFGPHQYRDMQRAGIPVVLGTDSIINLPPTAARTPAEGGSGISILDEMRFLFERDGTDPRLLLEMATTSAAIAIGLNPAQFELREGSFVAGLVCVQSIPENEIPPPGIAERALPILLMGQTPGVPELLLAAGSPSAHTNSG